MFFWTKSVVYDNFENSNKKFKWDKNRHHSKQVHRYDEKCNWRGNLRKFALGFENLVWFASVPFIFKGLSNLFLLFRESSKYYNMKFKPGFLFFPIVLDTTWGLDWCFCGMVWINLQGYISLHP